MFSIPILLIYVFGAFLLYFIYLKITQRKYRYPPSPPGSFITNNGSFMSQSKIHLKLQKMRNKYDKYLTLWVLNKPYVILNDFQTVVNLFVTKYPYECSGRHKFPLFSSLTENDKNIFTSNIGPQWTYQRKLFHSALRKVSQNSHLEQLVKNAFDIFKSALLTEVQNDRGSSILDMCYLLAYNITCATIYGKTFDLNDPDFKKLRESTNRVNGILFASFVLLETPIIHRFPLPTFVELKKHYKIVVDYSDDMIKEHESSQNYKTQPRDTIDYILCERDQFQSTGNINIQFLDDSYIRQSLVDLLFAGTDTTSMSIAWLLGLLSVRPEIVKKIREEISQFELEHNREISMTDKSKLVYVNAVLLEAIRYSSIVLLGVPHEIVTNDIQLDEYLLPPGTILLVNHYECNFDGRYWDKPDEFNPQRFIKEGKLIGKSEGWLPFSCDKRSCLGENVAKMEMFFLLCLIVKHFELEWSSENSDPDVQENEDAMFFRPPKDFKLIITNRISQN